MCVGSGYGCCPDNGASGRLRYGGTARPTLTCKERDEDGDPRERDVEQGDVRRPREDARAHVARDGRELRELERACGWLPHVELRDGDGEAVSGGQASPRERARCARGLGTVQCARVIGARTLIANAII